MNSVRVALAAALVILLACSQAWASSFTAMQPDTLDKVLAESKGKVVLVNFWATWCQPCRIEIPELIRLRQEHSEADLEVIGISLDNNPGVVDSFLKKNPINYRLFWAPPTLQRAFAVQAVPTIFFYNREGQRVWTQKGLMRSEQLKDMVKTLLAQ
ncbi:MAG: TlpA family protein disulfide reductase [Deltaproteobacteria bacterium]|nr:TlpA family protein disulfide reductase [Deltaproteobacteria bacterium]